MIEVHERLFVGNEADCCRGNEHSSTIHACKHPCHVTAVGYSGSLPSNHPNYLFLERGDDLFLNIIDPPVPLFKIELFEAYLSFAKRATDAGKSLLIHCNQGESRAPSLALVFLAKVRGAIANDSYAAARSDFERLFQGYRPGRGIQTFLSTNWQFIADAAAWR